MFSSVGMTWESTDEVVCSDTNFMAELAALLSVTPRETIGEKPVSDRQMKTRCMLSHLIGSIVLSANYLQWRLVYALGAETNDEMRKLFFEFSKKTTGISKPPDRYWMSILTRCWLS